MALSDEIVGWFDPEAKQRRLVARAKSDMVQETRRALRASRGYDGARHDRLTRDWRAGGGNADAEINADLPTLRNRSSDLVRNNPYVASAVRQLVANLIGDGIEARAVHSDPVVQALAQKVYLIWAKSKVDGRHDFYGNQRLACFAMIERGDAGVAWSPDKGVPDAIMTVVEGDLIESPHGNVFGFGGPRIVAGVEFAGGKRVAYHLLEDHPGDPVFGVSRKTRRVDAAHFDHLFNPTRPGQTRGVPWITPSMKVVRALQELDVSIATKKRMQACIGLIRTLSADEDEAGTGTEDVEGDEGVASGSPALDRLSPGMVVEGIPGETFTAFQPTADGDSDIWARQQLRSVAAGMGLPDYLMTGDVSQANYSSLRAAKIAFNTLLDDIQQNVLIPHLLDPAFERLMKRKALELGEPRLAEVTAVWTPPPRAWVDPVKDVAAKIMEQRAGFENMREALAERGIEWREHFNERAEIQKVIIDLGLVLDTDPSRVNGSGALQPSTGWVKPKLTDGTEERGQLVAHDTVSFFGRMIDAMESGDAAALNAGFIEAALAIRSGDTAKGTIIAALTGADEPENRTPHEPA